MKQVVLVCVLLLGILTALQAQEPLELSRSLAYIGRDGNVYITDGTHTAQITNDANWDDVLNAGIEYRQPRWSPDGQSLVFYRSSVEEGASYIVLKTGQPQQTLYANQTGIIAEWPFAWSPNSSEIVFFGYEQAEARAGLYRLSLQGGEPEYIALLSTLQMLGEADIYDLAFGLPFRERGIQPLRDQRIVEWNDEGILYMPAESKDYESVALIAEDGTLKDSWVSAFILPSPDGFVVLTAEDAEQGYEITDQPGSSVEIPEGHAVAWIKDRLLYTTRADVTVIESVPETQAWTDYWGEFWNVVYPAENSTLSLWQQSSTGEQTSLFTTEGYNFGVVRPISDTVVTFSIITSNQEVFKLLNDNIAPDESLWAHPISYVLEDGEVILTVEGGQPDYNLASFTVVEEE